ncbi:MAG TPA: DUF4157 domain-containing protein [Kofleriaceae bacterium]
MKATLATPAASPPAHRPASRVAAPRLTSVIGNRATRQALAGANAASRTPRPPVLAVQLEPSPAAGANAGGHGDTAVRASAARGIATPWSALPYADVIQRSFGRHDISGIQAHTGGAAAASATAIGADAYATGNHIVLGNATDLSTVAHEAAHVIQQRAGVQLKGGVGTAGDPHERHADAVAARVTAGQSAEGLLDQYASQAAGTSQVQCKTRIIDNPNDPQNAIAKGTGWGLLQDSWGNPSDEFRFGPLHNDCGTFMEAWLSLNHFDEGGTEPQAGTWPSWWAAAAPKPNNYWVRGHLLNHNLGGPGEKRNLTPITKKANSEHHNNVEKVLKEVARLGDSQIHYTVEAKYDGTGPTGLIGDAADPNPSVWDKLTLGFDCHYVITDDQDNDHFVDFFVKNER